MRRFDKNKNIKKANLLAERRYLKSKGLINEAHGSEPFPVYHNSYDSAIDAIEEYATSRGVTLDQNEYSNTYMDAFFKPKAGETKRDSLSIFKGGKEQRKALNIQIYNRGNDKFELNMYIN